MSALSDAYTLLWMSMSCADCAVGPIRCVCSFIGAKDAEVGAALELGNEVREVLETLGSKN